MNSTTKLVHSKTVAWGPTFRIIYSGVSKSSCCRLEFKGFVSGTCSPPFEDQVEISYFNVLGINFSKLIFDFIVATEALR